jgi:lipopolysaccharide export LptBFGC system permease protein LptF
MEKSFFASLVDNSFAANTFITRRVASVLYVIFMVLIAIGVIVGVLASLSQISNVGLVGILLLLGVVVWGFLSLVLIRLVLESAVALVLVAQNTSKAKSTK